MGNDDVLTRRRLLILAGLGGVAASLPSAATAVATAPATAAAAPGLALFPLVDTLADTSKSAAAARVQFDRKPLETMQAYGLEGHRDQWLLFASMVPGAVLMATVRELENSGFPPSYIDEWQQRTIDFLAGGWPCGDQYDHDKDCPLDPNSICKGNEKKKAPLDTKGLAYEAAVRLLYSGPAPKATTVRKVKKGEYLVLGEGFLQGAKVTVEDMAGSEVAARNPVVTGTFRCSRLTFEADLVENARYRVYVTNVWPGDHSSEGDRLGPAEFTA